MSCPEISQLANYEQLIECMRLNLARMEIPSVEVAVYSNGRSAAAGFSAVSGNSNKGLSVLAHSGCMSSLFMATLILLAADEGRLSLKDQIALHLPIANGQRKAALTDITVRHLLNHTHGLDESRAFPVPIRSDGRVDVELLCSRLTDSPPLFSPGSVCFQAASGPFLTAAILEHIFDCTFEELLAVKLLQPLGLAARRDVDGLLVLSAQDLLRIAVWHLSEYSEGSCTSHPSPIFAEMYRDLVPVSGYHLEQGAGLGWRWYGQEWFGQVAITDSTSAVVRLQRAEKTAFAVTCSGTNATRVVAALFGASLPDFALSAIPKRLSANDLETIDLQQYTGTYTNAATSLVIYTDSDTSLGMRIRDRLDDGIAWEGRLHPYTHELLRMSSDLSGDQGFIHFSHVAAKRFAYLHTGRELYRRTS